MVRVQIGRIDIVDIVDIVGIVVGQHNLIAHRRVEKMSAAANDDESEFTVAQGSALMLAPDAYISVNPGLFDNPPPPMLLHDVDDAALLALAADSAKPKRGRPRKSNAVAREPPKAKAPKLPKPPKPPKPPKETTSKAARGKSASRGNAGVNADVAPPAARPEMTLAQELDEMPTELILRENALLIDAIRELQSSDVDKAVKLQQHLHFNLVYLLSCDHKVPAAAASSTNAVSTAVSTASTSTRLPE